MRPIPASRVWAMPSADTFSVTDIGAFVVKHLSGVSVDPFARNCKYATFTNDINPNTSATFHMDAREFLRMLISEGVRADTIILDPPYSPRQISECYAEAGLLVGMRDTQTAAMKKQIRALVRQIASPDAVCLSFGWNTVGMGKGWQLIDLLMVCHGGDHNDTICLAEKRDGQRNIFTDSTEAA